MRRIFASLALSAALAAPSAIHAQSIGSTTQLSAQAPAPMIRADVAGIRRTDSSAPLVVNSAAAEGLHQGEGVALMAVGGAALIGGAIIGGGAGTAVAIGGLAVGLVGLYEYVR